MWGWIAAAGSLTAVYLAGRNIIWCWPLWFCATLIFLVGALARQDWPMVLLWTGYEFFNIKGYLAWRKNALRGARA